jgi:hypothetical protein
MRWLSSCLGSLAAISCGFGPVAGDPVPIPSAGASSVSGSSGISGSGGAASSMAGSAPGGATTLGGESGGGTGPIIPQGGSSGASSGGTGGAAGGAGGGAAGAGGTGPQIDPDFTLLWRDDFDTFDDARWTKATHTFPENLARFSAGNAVVEGGLLKLRVSNVPNGDKQYSAAEVLTKEEFTFGRFEGRIKFCAGSGMVSSLFTYKQDVNESWQEIDIEFLGYLPKSIQYNLISGTLNNRKYQPKVITLQYGPPTEFHDYAMEWKPDGITFYVDGVQTHKDVQATLQDAAHLHMNAWPTNNAVTSFAGPLDTSAIPCEAQYDWVAAYSYTP